jgi:hypothetical protein
VGGSMISAKVGMAISYHGRAASDRGPAGPPSFDWSTGTKFDNSPVTPWRWGGGTVVLQTDACPATNPRAFPAARTCRRQPIFQGFGVHEFLVIGLAGLGHPRRADRGGLATGASDGAHRDYVQLQPRPATAAPTRRAGRRRVCRAPAALLATPSPHLAVDWVGVGFVFVLAVAPPRGSRFRATTTTPSRTDTDDRRTPIVVVLRESPPPRRRPCSGRLRRPRHRRVLAAGFDNQLAAGSARLPRRRAARFIGRGPTA